jgi:hypothetical protein
MDNLTNKPAAFAFTGDELAKVILGNLGLKCNKLSQFSSVPAVVSSSSENATQAVSFPLFRRAAEILANPCLKFSCAKGGGTLAVESFNVYGCSTPAGTELVAVLRPENVSIVLYFATVESFLEWWTDLFACKENTPIINCLVPELPLEEFVFIMHVVDTYRRINMQSMLLYRPLKENKISVNDFMATFEVALGSGDVRWLMPAVFSVTPGLKEIILDLHPEIVDTAEALCFIKRTKNPNTGEDELIYLEPGITLGYEFATSWMFGFGLSVEVLAREEIQLVAREFLAPTSFSNHLFTIVKGNSGLEMFTHFALTLNEYSKHITGLLKKAAAKVATG